MKILICNYTGYRANWGSQATSRGLVQFLAKTVPQGMDVDIDIMPYPPTHWLDHWQKMVYGKRLLATFSDPAPGPDLLGLLERLCNLRFGPMMKRIRQADIIFFQGEGALGNGREFQRVQLFGPTVLAKHLYRKPVVSINQTVAYGSDAAEAALKAIFGSFDLNFVREPESLAKCAGDGWPQMALIPDAAFFYAPRQAAASSIDRSDYFCVTGSANLGAYDLAAYARGIRAIARTCGLFPVFLYSRSSDEAVSQAYRSLGEAVYTVINSATHPDVDQVLPILAGARAVVGGRYHTSISALSQAVPVILTASNSHKSAGLAQMLGAANVSLVADPTEDTLLAAMQAILAEGTALKTRLAQSVQNLADTASQQAGALQALFATVSPGAEEGGRRVMPDPTLSPARNAGGPLRALSLARNLAAYDRPGNGD